MVPDVDHLILPLIAYRHNIETGSYYLTLVISTRPNEWSVYLSQMSAAERSIQPVDCPTIDLDGDMGWLVQRKRDSGVGAKSITFGREDLWLAG